MWQEMDPDDFLDVLCIALEADADGSGGSGLEEAAEDSGSSLGLGLGPLKVLSFCLAFSPVFQPARQRLRGGALWPRLLGSKRSAFSSSAFGALSLPELDPCPV